MKEISEQELQKELQELTNKRIEEATKDLDAILSEWSKKHNCFLNVELKLQGYQVLPSIVIKSK